MVLIEFFPLFSTQLLNWNPSLASAVHFVPNGKEISWSNKGWFVIISLPSQFILPELKGITLKIILRGNITLFVLSSINKTLLESEFVT